jgi:hypothetical protein
MQIEKHLSGLLTGILIAGLCWLAFVVIVPPPVHAPEGTKKVYIPPKVAPEYKPSKPLNEDESVLPNTSKTSKSPTDKTSKPTEQALPPVVIPPSQGSTEYYGDKEELKLPPTTVLPQEEKRQDTEPKYGPNSDDGSTFYFGYDSGWEAPGATITPLAPKVGDEFDDRIIPDQFKKKDIFANLQLPGIMGFQLATITIKRGGIHVVARRTFD